jgi:hypothetical protein
MIDKETIEKLRNTDMIAFIERYCGYTFAYRGGAYRCKQHPSLAVKNDRRSFYWHSRGVGGYGVLDYLMKVENITFRDAVKTVAGSAADTETIAAKPKQEAEQPKALVLPEKGGVPLRLYDYLCCKRGIDSNIVNALIQEEKLYEDSRHNVVFVAYDEQGIPRFASIRGTYGDFRGDCAGSDKRYGFNMPSPQSDQLYIYEAPIDAMSHASIVNLYCGSSEAWRRRNRLSLGGTSDAAIPFFLNQHKAIKELVFCLDNDPPGQEAAKALSRKYAEKGYYVRIEPPFQKDFNIDLLAIQAHMRLEKSGQIRGVR